MNPGPVEEAGETARSFFQVMSAQPATLALVVANVCMLVFIFYALSKAAQFRQDMLAQQYTYQREVTALLARCVIPDGKQ